MTLHSRLFGAIGITLSVILAVLVVITLTLETTRVQRLREVHESSLQFAASLAASVPAEAYRDTLLLPDNRLHDKLAALVVFREEAEGTPVVVPDWEHQPRDRQVMRRARELVATVFAARSLRGERHPDPEVAAWAVPVPRARGEVARHASEGRPSVAYVELRPLDIDRVAVSRLTFYVIVAAGLALLAGTWIIVRQVVAQPLQDVVGAAQRVAEGDYATPIPSVDADDEIRKVVDAFNTMMLDLGALHERMQDRIGEALRRAHRTQESLVIAQRLAATGTLAAGIAHEVNNPLGGMLNAVRSLRTKEMTTERRDEYLELVDEGLRRIQATVAKILRFTPHRVAPQAVDLRDVVPPALALVRHRLDREGVEIGVELPSDPAPVFGDFYELQQALLNVVLNAMDAVTEPAREHPAVWIELEAEGDEVLLRVRDNGPGMAAADLTRAFDLFFTTKEQGKGSGLGLATVHKILDDHGGSVRLSSPAAGGMEVTFVLPRLRDWADESDDTSMTEPG